MDILRSQGGNSMWLRPSKKLLVYQKISGFKVVPHQNWMPSFIAFKNLQFLRFPKWGVTYLKVETVVIYSKSNKGVDIAKKMKKQIIHLWLIQLSSKCNISELY